MNIDKIRNNIKENKGNLYEFKFKGARNQIDEFIGIIVESYHSVFTVKPLDNPSRIKSYSYNDILINNLEFKQIALKK